jgi:hypothetical protein
MIDWVHPLKMESGSETDYAPHDLDPTEDGIAVKAIAFENPNVNIQKSLTGELQFEDPISGVKKLSDLGGGGSQDNNWAYSIIMGM